MSERVIISANPKSGSFNRQALVAELKGAIESLGYRCEVHSNLERMADRAYELASSGELRTVVAAGGDGTASTVASLIPFEIPLTLFPMGSENLLAKFYSISADPIACARSIQELRMHKIDVMIVNGRLSLLMASVGFDAEVVRRVHQSRKSHVSKLNYCSAIFGTLFRYRWPALKISLYDDNDRLLEEVPGGWVFVFNVPRYASGISIMSDAIEHDGYLDVGVFAVGGMFRNMWYYWHVIRGKHQRLKQWRRFRSNSVRVERQDRGLENGWPTSCQADGDWVSELPVTIQITGRKLSVVA